MKKLRFLSLFVLVFAGLAPLVSCGGGGGANNASSTAALSTLCGPRYDHTAGFSCPNSLCKSGLVYGSADDKAGPWSLGFISSDSLCTKACTTTADCQGISFAAANNVTVVVENWTCMTTSTGKYCAVSVNAPTGGGNSCTPCGGAFCSGSCIGCPGC
jgi:hypothetical protein